jgi:hypothetical protein
VAKTLTNLLPNLMFLCKTCGTPKPAKDFSPNHFTICKACKREARARKNRRR